MGKELKLSGKLRRASLHGDGSITVELTVPAPPLNIPDDPKKQPEWLKNLGCDPGIDRGDSEEIKAAKLRSALNRLAPLRACYAQSAALKALGVDPKVRATDDLQTAHGKVKAAHTRARADLDLRRDHRVDAVVTLAAPTTSD